MKMILKKSTDEYVALLTYRNTTDTPQWLLSSTVEHESQTEDQSSLPP